jgi:hypothetical protein
MRCSESKKLSSTWFGPKPVKGAPNKHTRRGLVDEVNVHELQSGHALKLTTRQGLDFLIEGILGVHWVHSVTLGLSVHNSSFNLLSTIACGRCLETEAR